MAAPRSAKVCSSVHPTQAKAAVSLAIMTSLSLRESASRARRREVASKSRGAATPAAARAQVRDKIDGNSVIEVDVTVGDRREETDVPRPRRQPDVDHQRHELPGRQLRRPPRADHRKGRQSSLIASERPRRRRRPCKDRRADRLRQRSSSREPLALILDEGPRERFRRRQIGEPRRPLGLLTRRTTLPSPRRWVNPWSPKEHWRRRPAPASPRFAVSMGLRTSAPRRRR
mmetsp:Transcript_8070/g.26504  ORF Transcript_8070/g.26504 Transcript_8070/m.26504 type:complete len:230 (-) Transcript_8070:101-790(-)